MYFMWEIYSPCRFCVTWHTRRQSNTCWNAWLCCPPAWKLDIVQIYSSLTFSTIIFHTSSKILLSSILTHNNNTSFKDHLEIKSTFLLRPYIHRPVFLFYSVFQLHNETTPLWRYIYFFHQTVVSYQGVQCTCIILSLMLSGVQGKHRKNSDIYSVGT